MIAQRVFMRGESQVSFGKEVHLIVLGQYCPYPDIKFTLVYQHRAFNVFLNHETQHSKTALLSLLYF
jgi:hypothetical protein